MSTRLVGQRVKRLEDPALLTGQGRFTDDIALPGTLHAAFVRSPYAHARVEGIDAEAARAMPGVHAVLTADGLPEPARQKRILLQVPHPAITDPLTQRPLARDEVCFVGEAVAVVVAGTRAESEDAAERVLVDYAPLPAVAYLDTAMAPGAATAHAHLAASP